MSSTKYQGILGSFVVITILLVFILIALIVLPGDDKLDFKFPDSLSNNKYVHLVDWPPQVQIVPGDLSCIEAGEVTVRAGRTELRNINGRTYCVTEIIEGAAGSTYTQYAYAFEHRGDSVILTFTTRVPQCGNYPDAERLECEIERGSFNPDVLIENAVREAEDN